MALISVVPSAEDAPLPLDDAEANGSLAWQQAEDGELSKPDEAPPKASFDPTVDGRVNITRPSDKDNEFINLAAQHGPAGALAVLRSRQEYGWFANLMLRAVEVCLAPREAHAPLLRHHPQLAQCDPVEFAIEMLEIEMIDEILLVVQHFEQVKEIQRTGLAIIELLVMDDPDWRDEIARKGGCELLCRIAKQRRDSPNVMCQVMTCMAYLAAEDYIEVMLCQYDALEYVTHILRHHASNPELVTRASLALLNLTVCEPHVEELMDKEAIRPVLDVLDAHSGDVHLVIILCGVLANFSVKADVRDLLVEEGVLERMHALMNLDPGNAVLQVACLKALVNYSTNPTHYMKMEALEIPTLVERAWLDHGHDPGVWKYGNYFLDRHTNCPIL